MPEGNPDFEKLKAAFEGEEARPIETRCKDAITKLYQLLEKRSQEGLNPHSGTSRVLLEITQRLEEIVNTKESTYLVLQELESLYNRANKNYRS